MEKSQGESEKNNISFIQNRNAFSTYFKSNGLTIQHASKIQEKYKSLENFENHMHTKTYEHIIQKIKKINIPFYFIGNWSKFDQSVLERLDNDEIKKYIINNTIPLYVDGKEYDAIAKLPPKQPNHFIHKQFSWTGNNHPTKYLHKCIGYSVYTFLKNKNFK